MHWSSWCEGRVIHKPAPGGNRSRE
jgi:hypothetical protein